MTMTMKKKNQAKRGKKMKKKKGRIKNEGRGWRQWECGAPRCPYREFQLHPNLHRTY